MKLKVFCSIVLYFGGVLVLTADEGAIVCGMGDMSGLRDKKIVIQCEVKSKIVITDAKINNGQCESPLVYLKRINQLHRQAALPSFADLKDFRRSYYVGESFYFAVPDGCAVEEFTVIAGDREYTWNLK